MILYTKIMSKIIKINALILCRAYSDEPKPEYEP